MIRTGIDALRAAQLDVLSVDATYRRGTEGRRVKAVVGRTVFRSTDESGIWTRVETRDFIVAKELLSQEPEVGDEIEFLGHTYEVLSPNGEPAWRWSDAFHTAYRIHAKNTGG